MASKPPRTSFPCSDWLNRASAKLQQSIYRQAKHKYKIILDKLNEHHNRVVEELKEEISAVENINLERDIVIKELRERLRLYVMTDDIMENKNISPPTEGSPVQKKKKKKKKREKSTEEDTSREEEALTTQIKKGPAEVSVRNFGKTMDKNAQNKYNVEIVKLKSLRDAPPSAISVTTMKRTDPPPPQILPPGKKRERSPSLSPSSSSVSNQSSPLANTSPVTLPSLVGLPTSTRRKKKKKKK